MKKRFIKISLISLLFLFTYVVPLYSYKLTIVYTGNTYSTLYPCGKCPASVGGGITRRATVIRKIKEREKNVILIDSGNFTAGGDFDSASINPNLDKKRTFFYYQAMQKMGYEVVGVGEEEFNFGKDFFIENLKKISFKFVSANLELEEVYPYYIKEFDDFKIGIIGLSPLLIYKKMGIEVKDYENALKETLKILEGKVDFIILLSSLGDEKTISLIEKFPLIKIAIVSGSLFNTSPYEKVKDAILFRPSYRGKDLRIIELEIENKKILNWEFKKERLSLDIEEDLEIKNLIPSCFRDEDCPKKEGLVARCQNPAQIESLCAYYEAKRIECILITDKKCPYCVVELPKKFLKDNFLGINFKILDYRNSLANKLIKKYQITTLPAFILPLGLKEEKNFEKNSHFFEKKKDRFFLKKELSGLFLYLEREEISNRLDYFLNLYDRKSYSILKHLIDFSKKNKVELHIHFVPPSDLNFNYFEEEIRIALAVKKVSPHKFFDYLLSRIKNINSIFWIKDVKKIGIEPKKIEELLKEDKKIEELMKEDNKLTRELKIREGNVILVKNNRIFKVFQIKEEDLKKFFR
jgi:hypothetical protein